MMLFVGHSLLVAAGDPALNPDPKPQTRGEASIVHSSGWSLRVIIEVRASVLCSGVQPLSSGRAVFVWRGRGRGWPAGLGQACVTASAKLWRRCTDARKLIARADGKCGG